ncbi:hypothetical protein H072_6332 [Dactylellina haptotyla CBS 200.50]|uniref:Uncharacterized protein n=1 Tax=Dactylellina haptotyla (strain CBS 200.50) TaxID=1284197 RepID=S8AAE5_DACHA|nr:hypothetical protein H072_6332 [Dactylellina haptotyla CBS 200.50]
MEGILDEELKAYSDGEVHSESEQEEEDYKEVSAMEIEEKETEMTTTKEKKKADSGNLRPPVPYDATRTVRWPKIKPPKKEYYKANKALPEPEFQKVDERTMTNMISFWNHRRDDRKDYQIYGGFCVQDDLKVITPVKPLPQKEDKRIHTPLRGNTGDVREAEWLKQKEEDEIEEVEEEDEKIGRTRTQTLPQPFVFDFTLKNTKPKPGDEEVKPRMTPPKVVRCDPGQRPVYQDENVYSYRMFRYVIAAPPPQSERKLSEEDRQREFVFTGVSTQSGVRGSIEITRGIFLPVGALHARLRGRTETRTAAYMLDYMTYLAHAVKDTSKWPPWATDLLKRLREKNTQLKTKHVQNIFDGSHIRIRDDTGRWSDGATWKFFGTVFDPNGSLEHTPSNPEFPIPEVIFQRWCDVAQMASSPIKESFSVNARFWKFPNLDTSQRITLYYAPPFGLAANLAWALARQDPVAELISDTLGLDKNASEFDLDSFNLAIIKAWREAVNTAHNKVCDDMKIHFKDLPKDKEYMFEKWAIAGSFDLENRAVEYLGCHPQKFYTVYITKADMDRMKKNWEYAPKKRNSTVSNMPDPWDTSPDGKVIPDSGVDDTRTLITTNKVLQASRVPRKPTQNSVMKVGAPSIAKALNWKEEAKGHGDEHDDKRAAEKDDFNYKLTKTEAVVLLILMMNSDGRESKAFVKAEDTQAIAEEQSNDQEQYEEEKDNISEEDNSSKKDIFYGFMNQEYDFRDDKTQIINYDEEEDLEK